MEKDAATSRRSGELCSTQVVDGRGGESSIWSRRRGGSAGLVPTGYSEWMASDMAADFGHSRRGRTLKGANRASSLFVLVAVGSVVAPENTVMISASVSARARSHQGLLYISSDDPFS